MVTSWKPDPAFANAREHGAVIQITPARLVCHNRGVYVAVQAAIGILAAPGVEARFWRRIRVENKTRCGVALTSGAFEDHRATRAWSHRFPQMDVEQGFAVTKCFTG